MRRSRPAPLLPALLAPLLLSPVIVTAVPPAGLPAVIVAPVVSMPLADRTEALGTLQANESVTITANVTETVSAIYFDDGQRVQRGAVLVELTSGEEHAMFEEATARVAEAQRQFDRVRSLERTGSAAASLLDERRRDLDIARAALVAVETRLADRLIKAPFDGVASS